MLDPLIENVTIPVNNREWHFRRFGGFDRKIIAMYAQGMTVREI